jgi:hypothetical protein
MTGCNHRATGAAPQRYLSFAATASQEKEMLPQQSVQHVENAEVAIALITLAIMIYWRVLLRLLIILAAVATAVGALVILEFMHI